MFVLQNQTNQSLFLSFCVFSAAGRRSPVSLSASLSLLSLSSKLGDLLSSPPFFSTPLFPTQLQLAKMRAKVSILQDTRRDRTRAQRRQNEARAEREGRVAAAAGAAASLLSSLSRPAPPRREATRSPRRGVLFAALSRSASRTRPGRACSRRAGASKKKNSSRRPFGRNEGEAPKRHGTPDTSWHSLEREASVRGNGPLRPRAPWRSIDHTPKN
jgi:hypothetical protein